MGEGRKFLTPIAGSVLLVDRADTRTENGIVVVRGASAPYMDFAVAAVNESDGCDFAPGDRVVVDDPFIGKRIMIDGAPYRLVPVEHVVAVTEG